MNASAIEVSPLASALLDHAAQGLFSGSLDPGNLENAQKVLFGSLILFFLKPFGG